MIEAATSLMPGGIPTAELSPVAFGASEAYAVTEGEDRIGIVFNHHGKESPFPEGWCFIVDGQGKRFHSPTKSKEDAVSALLAESRDKAAASA